MRTGLNVRHADEQLRGTIALPNGLGRDVRIAVFAQGERASRLKQAGADVVGGEDLAKRIEEGFDEFDVAIATPDLMSVVGRLGRILGPSGKMPNPKVGTVTMDVAKAVEESKSGKVEYRTDRTAIVHMVIGRASFDEHALLENYAAVIEELIRAKPSAAKGRYLRTITLTSTMGPGVKVDPSRTRDIVEEASSPACRRRIALHITGHHRPRQSRHPRRAPAEDRDRSQSMNRDQKAAAIAEIADHINESQAVFAVDYKGISVPQAAELRAKLRESDATFKVVKNSLTERAADEAGAQALKELLQGPTALTFVRGDIATAAKALADYGRATQLLPFKGGLMDGAALDPEQIRSISRLPSREALYGQLVGIVASPISGLVRTLGGLVGGLAVALGQVQEKKESGEIPAGEPPAAGEPAAARSLPCGEDCAEWRRLRRWRSLPPWRSRLLQRSRRPRRGLLLEAGLRRGARA